VEVSQFDGATAQDAPNTDPGEVARYVRENEIRLSPLSKREALKNIPDN